MKGWVTASRVLTAVGLVALLVFGLPRGPAPGQALRVDAGMHRDTLAAILAREARPALTWIDSLPPSRGVTELLAGAAHRGAEVTLAVPDGAGRLRVAAPDRPVAGRRSALRVSVRAEPDTVVLVTVQGTGGGIDTVRVSTGPDGRAAASVAVEPAREGAASWVVRSPEETAVVHAWVRPPSPVRVLVWSGPPGAESRYLVRALEATGMAVAARQELGRGLAVASRGVTAPRTMDDLADYDVVVRMGPGGVTGDSLLLRWVRERGGGLLLSGPLPSSSPLAPWGATGPGTDRPVSQIAWEGPAEIIPLPGSGILARVAPVPPGGVPVARLDGEPVVHLDFLGRGRILGSGLESWPWVMKGGLVAEHRAFWESVAEWLAGGLTEDAILVAPPGIPGARWEGRFEGEVPGEVLLAGAEPGASREEMLPVAPWPDGTGRTAFVPGTIGAVELRPERPGDRDPSVRDGEGGATLEGTRPPARFGMVAVDPEERPSWISAARRIGEEGGRVAAMDEGPGPPASDLPSSGWPRPWPWLLFVALAGTAATGWTIRRLQGLS